MSCLVRLSYLILCLRDVYANVMNEKNILEVHNLCISAVKDADQILILQEGKITERGTHEELLKNHGYYWETYALQNDLPVEGGAA